MKINFEENEITDIENYDDEEEESMEKIPFDEEKSFPFEK